MYEMLYIYIDMYIGVFFSLSPTQECEICVNMCMNMYLLCVFVCICVYLYVNVCNCVVFCVYLWYSVCICVYLCVFCVYLCVFVCIVCNVRICASQIEVQFRVPNELFIKVCTLGCTIGGCV